MSVIDDLKAARDEVEKGWCKFALEDKEGNVCVLGAIQRAIDWNAFHTTVPNGHRLFVAIDALARVLPEFAKGSVVVYNNHSSTTKEDVLNLFDKALADLGGLA